MLLFDNREIRCILSTTEGSLKYLCTVVVVPGSCGQLCSKNFRIKIRIQKEEGKKSKKSRMTVLCEVQKQEREREKEKSKEKLVE